MAETVLVTGTGHGLGRAVALEFARDGAFVIGCGRNPGPIQQTRDTIWEETEGDGDHVRCDVRIEADLEYLVDKIDTGIDDDIDVVVGNAAVYHGEAGRTLLQDDTYDHFDDHMKTNARGVFGVVKETLPLLADDARVLVPTHEVAREGTIGYGSYAVSKAAAEAVARGFAADLDITVGCLELDELATRLHRETIEAVGVGGNDPGDVAPMFLWAADELDADRLDGEIVDVETWREATGRLDEDDDEDETDAESETEGEAEAEEADSSPEDAPGEDDARGTTGSDSEGDTAEYES
jgi:NAD(P)-dependent dehydrogenase (short-subunit alcohol dehydrogenase family)